MFSKISKTTKYAICPKSTLPAGCAAVMSIRVCMRLFAVYSVCYVEHVPHTVEVHSLFMYTLSSYGVSKVNLFNIY